jgi:acyl phosphate:glycerol-3-phosphate acyltransferase
MLPETQTIYLALVTLHYLLGSILISIVLSKLGFIKNPLNYGSNNPGATNVFRKSFWVGMITLISDFAKSFIPLSILLHYYNDPLLISACAIAVVLGHNFPIFFNFKGGKGVATGIGVITALTPFTAAICAISWLASMRAFRNTGIASVSAILLGLTTHAYFNLPYQHLYIILSFIVIIKHHSNIRRYWNQNKSNQEANADLF